MFDDNIDNKTKIINENFRNNFNQLDGMDKKHIRFRNSMNNRINERIEGVIDDNEQEAKDLSIDNKGDVSFFTFFKKEVTRSYHIESDENKCSDGRDKIYSFLKIPVEVEKYMAYGFCQCADSFLYIYTFLPIRFLMVIWAIITRPIKRYLRSRNDLTKQNEPYLSAAEKCDFLKGLIVYGCWVITSRLDTSMMYHLVKSQSVIKLYIFYNMLEVGDRLFNVFGQDSLDVLYLVALESKSTFRPRRRQRRLGIIAHTIFAMTYVLLHTMLVLFQVTTLNVAINSSNKALLTIIISNNFVELKGSVFKKFDKSNLFQLSCADIRERFHLIILLIILCLQTMKEYAWKYDRLEMLIPDCFILIVSELTVDWVKHAFISRFNEIPLTVFKEYTRSFAYDMVQSRQERTTLIDPSDLVARRLGFIPLPLSVAMGRALTATLNPTSKPSNFILYIVGYLVLVALRVLNSIIVLGKACNFINSHIKETSKNTKKSTTLLNRTRSVDIIKENIETSGMAMFSNSAISLNNVCLNDVFLNNVKVTKNIEEIPHVKYKNVVRAESEPLLPQ
ncbi:protein TAPT1 homolog [Chelonus insularis]|uniref:protein TAPT1 homolog n=1 Tax=Chelonus insularis TaxID=460826 RepID=UPI00158ADC09|nr:protein TAPT1 homolog [Chelonus insularis]